MHRQQPDVERARTVGVVMLVSAGSAFTPMAPWPGKEAYMPAKGTAEWKSDVPTGTGTFTAGDSISGGYTYKSRFEDGPGSNPEQLIAAAHAACFSMALSNILAQAGNPPDSVRTEATVTLRPVDGVPTITNIALVTVGRVPDIDEAAFVEHALAAKAGCPVSRALAGVPRSLSTRLWSDERRVRPWRGPYAGRSLRRLAVTPAHR